VSRLLAIALLACTRPLPLPPSPDVDYCSQPHVMRAEEWRALCGQYPREVVLDGGQSLLGLPLRNGIPAGAL